MENKEQANATTLTNMNSNSDKEVNVETTNSKDMETASGYTAGKET